VSLFSNFSIIKNISIEQGLMSLTSFDMHPSIMLCDRGKEPNSPAISNYAIDVVGC